MSVGFRTRKRGTPRQIGKKFPIMEKKKLPPKIAMKIRRADIARTIKYPSNMVGLSVCKQEGHDWQNVGGTQLCPRCGWVIKGNKEPTKYATVAEPKTPQGQIQHEWQELQQKGLDLEEEINIAETQGDQPEVVRKLQEKLEHVRGKETEDLQQRELDLEAKRGGKISQKDIDLEKVNLRINELEAMIHHYKKSYHNPDKFEKLNKAMSDLERALIQQENLKKPVVSKVTIPKLSRQPLLIKGQKQEIAKEVAKILFEKKLSGKLIFSEDKTKLIYTRLQALTGEHHVPSHGEVMEINRLISREMYFMKKRAEKNPLVKEIRKKLVPPKDYKAGDEEKSGKGSVAYKRLWASIEESKKQRAEDAEYIRTHPAPKQRHVSVKSQKPVRVYASDLTPKGISEAYRQYLKDTGHTDLLKKQVALKIRAVKYPVEKRGPSYQRYLQKLRERRAAKKAR